MIPMGAAADDTRAEARTLLLREIAAMAQETGADTGRPRFSDRVMAAMAKVPRDRFVPVDQQAYAYENRPLPIGHGQTISQPFIVALMTELLDVAPTDRILEVGTGSGYQAALLAELAQRVYTIEIVEPVGLAGARALRETGYTNVETRIGDGYKGWPEAAPFDGIIVTAAPAEIPQPLLDQLKPGGRMVIPVGGRWEAQRLIVITKTADNRAVERRTILVRFVPLTRAK
jgi:protein-L-isoaspartate(D-aspartate) O-methyltransferase